MLSVDQDFFEHRPYLIVVETASGITFYDESNLTNDILGKDCPYDALVIQCADLFPAFFQYSLPAHPVSGYQQKAFAVFQFDVR
jgi:hypothetical protein